MSQADVIDAVLGPEAAAAVEPLRAQKAELAAQMQDYYDAVFLPGPESTLALSPSERWLIAIRTASHTGSTSLVDWYVSRATDSGTSEALIAKAQDVSSPWNGDPRTTAIMRQVDLIVTRPVESSKADISALSDAGLSPQGIVALSQVVAYVSYQLRLIATLRALGATA